MTGLCFCQDCPERLLPEKSGDLESVKEGTFPAEPLPPGIQCQKKVLLSCLFCQEPVAWPGALTSSAGRPFPP